MADFATQFTNKPTNTMKLNIRQRRLLAEAYREIMDLRSRPRICEHGRANEKIALRDAESFIVRLRASAWLQTDITPSMSVLLARDYQRLQDLGLITKISFTGERTTHIQLTPSGIEVAKELLTVSSCEDRQAPEAPTNG